MDFGKIFGWLEKLGPNDKISEPIWFFEFYSFSRDNNTLITSRNIIIDGIIIIMTLDKGFTDIISRDSWFWLDEQRVNDICGFESRSLKWNETKTNKHLSTATMQLSHPQLLCPSSRTFKTQCFLCMECSSPRWFSFTLPGRITNNLSPLIAWYIAYVFISQKTLFPTNI